ncbi:hypothetical protein [Candidatus Stoquefichus sp. SB1]|uniref:hypothetical protein n=1 Tax=Candidatus Stoquefichus sp. SB1 TaxID=1658109 RepID=UPI0012FEF8E8|nr:hypothetical protein [Candidatus Stoquefichus sp. SB1]
MKHISHETRHIFISQVKKRQINDYILKIIIGYEIRDVTERIYTHRTIEELRKEMIKIKF